MGCKLPNHHEYFTLDMDLVGVVYVDGLIGWVGRLQPDAVAFRIEIL